MTLLDLRVCLSSENQLLLLGEITKRRLSCTCFENVGKTSLVHIISEGSLRLVRMSTCILFTQDSIYIIKAILGLCFYSLTHGFVSSRVWPGFSAACYLSLHKYPRKGCFVLNCKINVKSFSVARNTYVPKPQTEAFYIPGEYYGNK